MQVSFKRTYIFQMQGDEAMLRDRKGTSCWVSSICSSRSTFHTFPPYSLQLEVVLIEMHQKSLLLFVFWLGLAHDKTRQNIGMEWEMWGRRRTKWRYVLFQLFPSSFVLDWLWPLTQSCCSSQGHGFSQGGLFITTLPFGFLVTILFPHPSVLEMVNTTLLLAPRYRATLYIFLYPAHDFVNSPFAKPLKNYPN